MHLMISILFKILICIGKSSHATVIMWIIGKLTFLPFTFFIVQIFYKGGREGGVIFYLIKESVASLVNRDWKPLITFCPCTLVVILFPGLKVSSKSNVKM